jgi:hypothetical protein
MVPENYQCYYEKNCSGEFLLSGAEIKSTGKMKEGIVPFPPYRPCALRDDDVLPVQDLSLFFGEQKAAEVIPPVVGSSFFDRFQ